MGNLLRRLRKVHRLVQLPPSERMSLLGNLPDFGRSLMAQPNTAPATPEYAAAFRRGQRDGDWLAPYLYADIKVLLPEEMFTKLDRMAMAHSLEGRVPLVDYRIIELAARIPSRMKLKRGEVKAIMKKAMRERLPAEVLTRHKVGFRAVQRVVSWSAVTDGTRPADRHLVPGERHFRRGGGRRSAGSSHGGEGQSRQRDSGTVDVRGLAPQSARTTAATEQSRLGRHMPLSTQTLGIVSAMYASWHDGGVYIHLSFGRVIDRLAARAAEPSCACRCRTESPRSRATTGFRPAT